MVKKNETLKRSWENQNRRIYKERVRIDWAKNERGSTKGRRRTRKYKKLKRRGEPTRWNDSGLEVWWAGKEDDRKRIFTKETNIKIFQKENV